MREGCPRRVKRTLGTLGRPRAACHDAVMRGPRDSQDRVPGVPSMTLLRAGALCAALVAPIPALAQQNIILFVADGLRAAAVSPERAPAFAKIRDTGVNFANSHSLWPTITTVNAARITSGRFVADTSDWGNAFYTGFPVASAAGTVTPFIQDNAVLKELNQHHGRN